jgi:hypothetical protein
MATKAQIFASMDEFTTAYIECMLWSSTDESDESGGNPLDQNYGPEDIDLKALRSIVKDCADFQDSHEYQALAFYVHKQGIRTYTPANGGHDFWLTRNGHGAGFWDRGFGAIGDRVTEAAEVYGGCDLYIHRKRVHIS